VNRISSAKAALAVLAILCVCTSTHSGAAKTNLPNIVFVLADDMSYDSVSHLNPAIGNMKTPHIDRLAREGLVFDDGHSASAVCTPTRYGILTGRYCWRTPLKNSVLWTYGQPLIEPGRLTMSAMLKKRGYRTFCVGKWHLGMVWPGGDGQPANRHLLLSDKTWGKGEAGKKRIADCEGSIDWDGRILGPCSYGFDRYFGVDVPNFPPYTWIGNDRVLAAPTVPKPGKMFGAPGLMREGWQLDRILPSLAERAAEWVAEAAADSAPYFLYLPLTSPHTPIAPSERFRGKSGISEYADFVMETDWAVGHVLKAVDASGEAGNTLFVFSTDNGTSGAANFKQLESRGVDLHHHFRGHKTQIYEGGHRVPLIVRWPRRVKAGRRTDQTVCLNDFFATFAEVCGHPLRDSEGEDSLSLLPLITGEIECLRDHPMVVHHSYGGQFSIRDGRWKLILPMNPGGKPVLYDLEADTKETTNVAAKHPETVKTLTQSLKQYVTKGRSTAGVAQTNHGGQTQWKGLPW
jgi:arylsulfatase A